MTIRHRLWHRALRGFRAMASAQRSFWSFSLPPYLPHMQQNNSCRICSAPQSLESQLSRHCKVCKRF